MPFAQLHHSKDISLTEIEYASFFKEIYEILYAKLGGISSFKASVIPADYAFVITDGQQSSSFAFLRILMLKKAERTDEVKQKAGEQILAAMQRIFKTKVSIEIADIGMLFK